MKRISIWLSFFFSVLVMSACGNAFEERDVIAPPTQNTLQITKTPFRTITPVPTPTPTLFPGLKAITLENVSQLEQISSWGKGTIDDFAYSPDGQLLATGSINGIFLYRNSDHKQVGFIESECAINVLVFSPDGKTILAGSGDNSIRIWSTDGFKLLMTLVGHADLISVITFSPDGQIIASGSFDKTIRLWSASSYEPIASYIDNRYRILIRSLSFSPDGTEIASAGYSGIQIWQLGKNHVRISIQEDQTDFRFISYSPDGTMLISGSQVYDVKSEITYGKIRLWKASDGSLIAEQGGEMQGDLAVSSDCKTLATYSSNGTVRLWNLAGKSFSLRAAKTDSFRYIYRMRFSPDNNYLFAATTNGALTSWELPYLDSASLLIEQSRPIRSIAISHDGNKIITGSSDNILRLMDVKTGEVVRIFEGHTDEVTSVSFSVDDQQIVSGSFDKTVRLWQVNDITSQKVLMIFKDVVADSIFSPDGKIIAAASQDGTVKVIHDNSLIILPNLSNGKITDVVLAITPDNKYLAIGLSSNSKSMSNSIFLEGNSVKFWDLDNQEILDINLSRHSWGVSDIVFSPNYDYLITGGADGKILLWKITSRDPLEIKFIPEQYLFLCQVPNYCSIQKLALSSDGRFFVSARANGRLDIGSTSDNQIVFSKPDLDFHNTSIWPTDIVFSPDGKLLYTSGYDGLIRIWGIP